jgi:Asp-tRNA(Asn)/Glu-tRNA(Gln) amidotransferase A subunit family amidase
MTKKEDLLAFSTIEDLSVLLAKRKISPVELTEQFLRRIELYNSRLNAYLTVTAEHALAAARKAEKTLNRRPGGRHHPLLGIPIAIKDNIWTQGIRTTAGSLILRDFVPAEDATVTRKLERAGAILSGENKSA